MATVSTIYVKISGDSSALTRALGLSSAQLKAFGSTTSTTAATAEKSAANISKSFGSLGSTIGNRLSGIGNTVTQSLGIPLTGAQAAVLALGAASLKLASDFEDSMVKIRSLVGASDAELQQLTKSVLDLATTLPESPKQLADALFFIESAGQRGSEALNTLELSAKAAAAGLGDTKTVADAVTSAMNAYATTGLTAAHATDVLIAAVREGKLAPEDLAGALGQVLPVAASLGVSFDEVAAAIASATREGLDASRAATGVRFLLSSFTKPASQAVTALKSIGLSVQDLQDSLASQGLLATLQLLAARFDLSSAAGKQMFATVVGGARGLSIASILVGQNAEAVGKIFDSVAHSTGSLDRAFESASKTVSFQAKAAWASLQVVLIELGQAVLPLIAVAFKAIADVLHAVAPLLKVVADNAKLIAVAFLAFLAVSKAPLLLVPAIVKLGEAFAVLRTAMTAAAVAAAQEATAVGGARAGIAAFTGTIGASVIATGAWTAALVLVGVALTKLQTFLNLDDKKAAEWTQQIEAGTFSLVQLKAAVDQVTGDQTLTDKFNGDQTVLDAYGKTVQQVTTDIHNLNAEQLGGSAALKDWGFIVDATQSSNLGLIKTLDQLLVQADKTGLSFTDAQRSTLAWQIITGDLNGAIDSLSHRLGFSTTETKKLTQAQLDAADAAKEQRQAEQALAGGLLGLIADNKSLRDAQKTLNDLQAKGIDSGKRYEAAVLTLAQSHLQLNQDIKDYIQNLKTSGDNEREAVNKVFALVKQFSVGRDTVRQMTEQVFGLGSALKRVPPITVKDEASSVIQHNISLLDQFQRKLASLHSQHVVVSLDFSGGGQIVVAGKRIPITVIHQGGSVGEDVARTHASRLASDEVPAILQQGEFVIRRSAARKIGIHALRSLNRLHEGGVVPRTPIQAPLPVKIPQVAPLKERVDFDVRTEDFTRSVDEMTGKLADLRRELDKLNDTKVQTTVLTHYRSTGVQP